MLKGHRYKFNLKAAQNRIFVQDHMTMLSNDELASQLNVSLSTIQRYKKEVRAVIAEIKKQDQEKYNKTRCICWLCAKACNGNLCSWVNDFTPPEGAEFDKDGFLEFCTDFVEG